MKSFVLRAEGDNTKLEQRELPMPKPGASQILVRMHAAGLNRGEFLARRDLHAPTEKPAGNEGAGEVVALGSDVSSFRLGDRVMGVCSGAFSEYAVMEERTAILVPRSLSWDQAACTPLTFLVVYDMVVAQGRLQRDAWMLVTGTTSGVGVAAIQTAKALGAHTIGTSGSEAKLAKLKTLGLEIGLCTRKPDFHAAVRAATDGRGVNLAINNVGGSMFSECIRSLAFEGRLAIVGYLDRIVESMIDLAAVHANRLTIFGVSALLRTREQRAETVRAFVTDLLPLIADGRITPLVDRTYEFKDLPAAKAYMESDAHLGKIAIRIVAE